MKNELVGIVFLAALAAACGAGNVAKSYAKTELPVAGVMAFVCGFLIMGLALFSLTH